MKDRLRSIRFDKVLRRARKWKPWTRTEDENLIRLRSEGQNFATIREQFQHRTYSAVRGRIVRLIKLGRLKPVTKAIVWTKDEDEALLRLRAQGKSMPQIVSAIPRRSYAAAKARLQGSLRELASLPLITPKSPAWIKHEDEAILNLRGQGKPLSEISSAIPGRSYDAVRSRMRDLKALGFVPPAARLATRWTAWTKDEDEKLLKLLREGKPVEAIAEAMPQRSLQAVRSRRLEFVRENKVPRIQMY